MQKEKKMRGITTVAFALLLSGSSSQATAQHQGHSAPPPEAGGGACVEHARQSLQIIDRLNRRLEEARQSNNPAKMRAAMDDLQGALGELQTQQSLSISAAGTETMPTKATAPGSGQAMEMMDHSTMGHEMSSPAQGGAQPARTAAPGDTKKAPPSKAKVVDPVCGMSVEPKAELQTSYRGKTYFFCSTDDKEKFLREPGKYVKP